MYERASPEAPLRGSKTTNTSQLPPPHRVQTTRANAQQRRRVASRRIASPKRHRASSHRGTHLRRESPAIANNIQANLKMSEDEDEFEAEERRKDEAGAKAAQELADKQLRHLNKKVREDPDYPINCTCRTDGEVPSPQLDELIHVRAHPELTICDDRTGALSNFAIATATKWNEKFGKQYASEPVTLQTSKGDLTFKKKNKNVDGGQKTVAGYCCSVEGKEYWIHDSNKPTLYPPTYLAFEQHQYDADPDHYNSREAILEEYRYLGFPGNKTPKNIQRCRTDWLSTISAPRRRHPCPRL